MLSSHNFVSFWRALDSKNGLEGSHRIFTRHGMEEILNLQPKGSKAKPYQVKQVRNILVKYRLGETDVD